MIESQYTELFIEYRNIIDSNSSSSINKMRDKAFKDFSNQKFPSKHQEDYQYIDIQQLFAPDFALNLKQVPFLGDPYKAYGADTSGINSHLHFMLNDLFHQNTNILDNNATTEGIFIGSLKNFSEQHPDIFEKYYAQLAKTEKDSIAAFNTMFIQDGFVIYIPKNKVLDKPVQLVNILKSKLDYLVNRRILIIAEENTEGKILLCDHTIESKNFMTTQVVEIFASKNSRLDIYDLEENSKNVTRLSSTYIQQDENSKISLVSLNLHSGKSRNNIFNTLIGKHAEFNLAGLVIADDKEYVDNFISVEHCVPECISNQNFKYIVDKEATGVFCGKILVDKDAQKTQAYQINKNLCSSPKSKMYAKPQLEIYADDVKCSHGLTTGQIDEDALFYIRSRGIDKEYATLLLKQAFAAEIIEHIKIDDLQLRLNNLLNQRLNGEDVKCTNCNICN